MMQTETQKNTSEDQSLIEEIISRWGCPTSQMALDLPCNQFRAPGIEGIICYKIEAGCAVVLGDPICAPENRDALALSFHQYAGEQKLKEVYLIVSESFANWAAKNLSCASMEIGEEICFNPGNNGALEGHKGQRMRNRLNHAKKIGLSVHEYYPPDEKIENAIQNVGEEWLKGRSGPQIHISHLNFFAHRKNKRWFYLQDPKGIIGMAVLCKLEARNGWFLKFLIITPGSPRGSSEFLMETILETLQQEQCPYLSCGIITTKSIGETVGLGKLSEMLARGIYKAALWMFNLSRRKEYWQKFDPLIERSFILFGNKHLGLSEIKAIIKCLKIDY